MAFTSSMHLIDLAGSESFNASISAAVSSEGAGINQGLLALGKVLTALADVAKAPGKKGRELHVSADRRRFPFSSCKHTPSFQHTPCRPYAQHPQPVAKPTRLLIATGAIPRLSPDT